MLSESWATQTRKGLLELCILNLIKQKPLYGYEIIKKLTSIPELVITEGTLYPMMSRLKKEGLVKSVLKESSMGPVRKYYSLTALGKKHVKEINSKWGVLIQSISKIIEKELL